MSSACHATSSNLTSSRTALPERFKNVPSSLYDDPAFSSDPTLNPYFVTNHTPHVAGSRTPPHLSHLNAGREEGRPSDPSITPASSFDSDARNHPTPSVLCGHIAGTSYSVVTQPALAPSLSSAGYPPPPANMVFSAASAKHTPEFVKLAVNTDTPAQSPLPSRLPAQKLSSKQLLPPPYTEVSNTVPFVRSGGISISSHSQDYRSSSSLSDVSHITTRIHRSKNRSAVALDRIDELDETNPLGISLHHESPYEAISRLVPLMRPNGGGNTSTSASYSTGAIYRNEHLAAPSSNMHIPLRPVAGAYLSLPPGALYTPPAFTQTPDMEPKDRFRHYLSSSSRWNTTDMTPRIPSNSQSVEFDPYDPVNLAGPVEMQRNLEPIPVDGLRTSVNQESTTPSHTGSSENPRSSISGHVWHSYERQDSTKLRPLQQDQDRVNPIRGVDSNNVELLSSKMASSMHLHVVPGDVAGTKSRQPKDGHNMTQSIKSSSGSSQTSRSYGKPQFRHIPKKLVMPAPLQSSVITPPSHQARDIHQSGILLPHQVVQKSSSFMPTHSNKGPVVKTQDIPTAVSRKLRKRVTSNITPVDGTGKFEGVVRFADPPNISIAEKELTHSTPLTTKKRVLKKRVGF